MPDQQAPRNRRVLTRWLPILLGIAVAAGMIVFIVQQDILAGIDLGDLRWGSVGLLLLSICLTWYLNGLSLAIFVQEKGIKLDFTETFGLTVASLLVNKITPVAGALAVKAGYLKRRFRYPLSNYLALLTITILVNYMVSGFLGLVVIGVIALNPGARLIWEAIPIMAGLLLLPILILILPWEKLRLPQTSRIVRWITRVVEGWNQIRANRPLLVRQFLVVFALVFSKALSYWLAPQGLGISTPPLDMVFISILTNITRVTPIRDIFGLTEFISGIGTQLTGSGLEVGVTAALMIRITSIIGNLIFGPIYIYVLSKRLGASLLDQEETLSL